jgi:uncharacterized membrane protein YadS
LRSLDFLYSVLFQLNQALIPGGASGFGVYAGATIHDVAQVVATGRSIGPDAADTLDGHFKFPYKDFSFRSR